MCSQERYNTWV